MRLKLRRTCLYPLFISRAGTEYGACNSPRACPTPWHNLASTFVLCLCVARSDLDLQLLDASGNASPLLEHDERVRIRVRPPLGGELAVLFDRQQYVRADGDGGDQRTKRGGQRDDGPGREPPFFQIQTLVLVRPTATASTVAGTAPAGKRKRQAASLAAALATGGDGEAPTLVDVAGEYLCGGGNDGDDEDGGGSGGGGTRQELAGASLRGVVEATDSVIRLALRLESPGALPVPVGEGAGGGAGGGGGGSGGGGGAVSARKKRSRGGDEKGADDDERDEAGTDGACALVVAADDPRGLPSVTVALWTDRGEWRVPDAAELEGRVPALRLACTVQGPRSKRSAPFSSHGFAELVGDGDGAGGGGGDDDEYADGAFSVRFPSLVPGGGGEDDNEGGGDCRALKVGLYTFEIKYTEVRAAVLVAVTGRAPVDSQASGTQPGAHGGGRRGPRGVAMGDGGSQVDDAEVAVVARFALRVVPGAPASVALLGRPGLLQDLAASDRTGDDRGRTLVAPRAVKLAVADAGGVPVTTTSLAFASVAAAAAADAGGGAEGGGGAAFGGPQECGGLRLRCRIEVPSADAGDDVEDGINGYTGCPALEGADGDGWVASSDGDWDPLGGNAFSFNALVVAPQANGQAPPYADGTYALVFAPWVDGGRGGAVWGSAAALRVLFTLTTDAARIEAERARSRKRADLEARIEPLRLARDARRHRKEEASAAAAEAERAARAAVGSIPGPYRVVLTGEDEGPVALPSKAEAAALLARWRHELAEMTAGAGGGDGRLAGQARAAVVDRTRPEYCAQVDSLRPRGRLVELAFLNDDRLALLTSWYRTLYRGHTPRAGGVLKLAPACR